LPEVSDVSEVPEGFEEPKASKVPKVPKGGTAVEISKDSDARERQELKSFNIKKSRNEWGKCCVKGRASKVDESGYVLIVTL